MRRGETTSFRALGNTLRVAHPRHVLDHQRRDTARAQEASRQPTMVLVWISRRAVSTQYDEVNPLRLSGRQDRPEHRAGDRHLHLSPDPLGLEPLRDLSQPDGGLRAIAIGQALNERRVFLRG